MSLLNINYISYIMLYISIMNGEALKLEKISPHYEILRVLLMLKV